MRRRFDKETTMKELFLLRATRTVVGLFVSVMLLAGAIFANAAEPTLDDNWHFTIIPYLWVPSVNGKMNVTLPQGVSSDDFDMASSDYFGNLSFAAMLSVELEKGRWSVVSDIMYVDFSDDNRTVAFPGQRIEIKGDTSLRAFVFEIAPAYSLYRTDSVRFDLLAGLRYAGIDSDVTLNPVTTLPFQLPSRNVSDNKDLFDPIVGFKGRFELGKGWFLPYYADVGGFGINNEWSWQAYAGVGYRFSKLFSLALVYRHLQYNFDDDRLLKDFYLSGAELGFIFRF